MYDWSKMYSLVQWYIVHTNKNPAYGRHRLSRHVRIVAPILLNPACLTLFLHFWSLCSNYFCIFFNFLQVSGTQKYMSCVTCHMSHVTCHLPHVTFHLTPVTDANSHQPSPADPFFTVDWFQIQKILTN